MSAMRLLGVVGVAVLLPALAAAQQTTYNYDKAAPFATYRTYALEEGTSSGDTLVDARIVAALEDQLTLRGLSKLSALPDIKVMFHVTFDKGEEVSLAIDVVDVKRQQIVWRGFRRQDFDPDTHPYTRGASVAKAVARIMRNYPPESDHD